MGGTAISDGTSVSDFAGVAALVEGTVATYGRLDAVVNNAGIVRDRMLTSMSEEEFDLIVAVHLKGTFNLTRHACDHWRSVAKAGGLVTGRIVNTTSGTGLFGNVGQANYGAAKAAIANLTVITAMEMDRYGVTANAISPIARTRMTEGFRRCGATSSTDRGTASTRRTPRRWSPGCIGRVGLAHRRRAAHRRRHRAEGARLGGRPAAGLPVPRRRAAGRVRAGPGHAARLRHPPQRPPPGRWQWSADPVPPRHLAT